MIHGLNVKFEAGQAHLTVTATLPIPQERQSSDASQCERSPEGRSHTIHDILSSALSELVFGRIQPALQTSSGAAAQGCSQPQPKSPIDQAPDQSGSEVRFGLSKRGGYELSVILEELPDQEMLLRLAAQNSPLQVLKAGLAACEALADLRPVASNMD